MEDHASSQAGLATDVPAGYPANEKWQAHLLDQYKLYVEMADRVSQRRAAANTYFLSLNSAILAFVGYAAAKDAPGQFWMIALAGVALSLLWERLITSYARLNAAKFRVIHALEQRLPVRPYEDEWAAMGGGRDPRRYLALSRIERGVPYVFMALHGIVLARSVSWCWPAC